MSFSHGGDLKRHIHTHTGDKTYSCEYCNKSFSNLQRHKYTQKRSRTNVNIVIGGSPWYTHTCQVGKFGMRDIKVRLSVHK